MREPPTPQGKAEPAAEGGAGGVLLGQRRPLLREVFLGDHHGASGVHGREAGAFTDGELQAFGDGGVFAASAEGDAGSGAAHQA